MCNLSKGIWEKGMEAGIEVGMETGRKEGAEKAMLDSIKTLMETMSFTAEQAMTALKVPEADRPRYLDTLNGQK